MMVLQHSVAQWESPYFGILAINIILFNSKVGTSQ